VDGFVGTVHLVIAAIAPGARIVDLSHLVAVHDVAAGARTLARAAPWLSEVVLAVVDPGVGSARRGVAVEALDRSRRPAAVLVGPDNGLLLPAVRAIGGFGRVVALDQARWHGGPVPFPSGGAPRRGATFDGRDVFAPVAAHLANGVDVAELGSPLEAGGLVDTEVTPPEATDRSLSGTVGWIDRFGNAQLDVDPALTAGWGPRLALGLADGRVVKATMAATYSDVPGDALGMIIDADGCLAMVCNRASAAAALGLQEGDGVSLAPAEGPSGQTQTGR